MVYDYLFSGLIGFYLAGATSALLLNRKDRLCAYAAFSCAALAGLTGILFSILIIVGDTYTLILPGVLAAGILVDKLAAFFLLVISISVFAVSLYSMGYVREYFGKKNIGYLGVLYNLFILSMVLVVSADNAVMFLIVWEVMSILSYFLVVYEHEQHENRRAGMIYLIMTHIGTGFIILSFLIFAGTSGSFAFASFSLAGSDMPLLLRDAAFLCALIGFGTKAGIVPLHIWLPHAHPVAPSNVSALMSGVMIKTAIFMLIRVSFDFLGASGSWWGYLVLMAGSVSALLGILYAVVEPDIKRMLAFSSIENIGIILIGIGASLIFQSSGHAALSALAAIAALYHLLNHSVFKSLLFMGAGAIICSTHTKHLDNLGGLIKRMPVSSVLVLIGILSISALPPFSGFMSEWLIFHSLLQSFSLPENFAIIALSISAAVLALTGALAAYCFLKTFGIGFLALPRSVHAADAEEVNNPMLLGMGILAFLSVLLGLLPMVVLPVLDRIVAPFTGAYAPLSWGSLGTVTLPSQISLSTPVLLLLLVFPLLIMLAVLKPRPRVYETWGCGQPRSGARQQYTAMAFSKPIQIWFKDFYRPADETQATYSPSTFIKESFKVRSSITQIFEVYFYLPIIDFVWSVSRRLKIIQTGSIHAYLAYIFVTLVILFMFVIIGGTG